VTGVQTCALPIYTYQFDPTLPADVDAKLLLGIQANLWTEKIPTFRHLQ
jgi:N-acetyl-beta-hexosaminidase